MKSILVAAFGVLVGSAILFAADGDHQHMAAMAPTTAPATQPAASATPVNKKCPINTDDDIDPKVTVTYNGKVYGFCCSDCVAEFNKNPEKYKDAK